MTARSGLPKYDGLQVFSATRLRDRNQLGTRIADWMRKNPDKVMVGQRVVQSSDRSYHCLTVLLFWALAASPWGRPDVSSRPARP